MQGPSPEALRRVCPAFHSGARCVRRESHCTRVPASCSAPPAAADDPVGRAAVAAASWPPSRSDALCAIDMLEQRSALWVRSHRRSGRRGRARAVRAGGHGLAVNASCPQHQLRRAAEYRLPDIASQSASARRGSAGRISGVEQHSLSRVCCHESQSALAGLQLAKVRICVLMLYAGLSG